MIQALIIEDEKPSARRLQRMLEKLEVEVIETLHAVDEAVEWFLQNKHPDLILLDIQLSDGLSFEIFQHVTVQSAIIFTTAYDEYALKAFKLNSIDYLLKPIDDEELDAALVKFRKNHQARIENSFDIQGLKSLLNMNSPEYKTRFALQVGQHLKLIKVEDISCFYSENKATYVQLTRDRRYLMDTSLDKLQEELDPTLFFRVNRKFIIKEKSIQDIIAFSNQRLEIELRDYKKEKIIVSRERVKSFRDWLG